MGLSCSSFAQVNLRSQILDETGQPVSFANVVLNPGEHFAISDEDGRFEMADLPYGIYTLQVASLGYRDAIQTVNLSQVSRVELSIVLQQEAAILENVVVTAKSQVRVLNEQPLAISSIDFSAVQNSNLDAAALLDRINGVRVRQSGGVGSDVNISIQGAQGNAVRRYYDGLPIRFLAAGLDINSLPVNQIERVDIYRGVTPLEVGTDALGGGINIVPKRFYRDQLDISYQFGSFQTHRASANAFVINEERALFAGSNLFFNYSANNYPIDAHDFNEATSRAENNIVVRRFHDAFRASYADLFLGLRDRPWADEIKLTVLYSDLYDEVQTGIVFNPVRPAGDAFTRRSGFNGSLDYRWAAPDSRLQITSKTTLGNYEERIRDSTAFFYNWYGETLNTPNNRGTDLLAAPADITIDRRVTLQRNTFVYQFSGEHQLTLSNLWIQQDRRGRNRFLDPEGDPFRLPAQLQQNYAGLAYDAKWFDQRLTTVLTYKNYHLSADATSLEDALGQDLERNQVSNNYNGGNLALKYAFTPNLFLRSSFEYAYRLPEEAELFGNQSTIRSNVNLRPEQSNNLNLGAFYKFKLFGKRPMALELNGFYRYQQDRIILLASGFDLAQFFNEEEVEITGLDGYLSLQPTDRLTLNASATYQDVRIRSALVGADQDLIGTQLPNVPRFFASADASYRWEGTFVRGDDLNVAYFFDHVYEFSSVREANTVRNPANFVPTQNIHSLELTYTFPGRRINLSARINNIFDDDLFDNFRIQRPGRNVNVKIRYTL